MDEFPLDECLSALVLSLWHERGWTAEELSVRARVSREALASIEGAANGNGRVALSVLGAVLDALLADDHVATLSALDGPIERQLLAILADGDQDQMASALKCLGAAGGVGSLEALALIRNSNGFAQRVVSDASRAKERVLTRLRRAGIEPGQLTIAGVPSAGAVSLDSITGRLSKPDPDEC